MEPKNVIEVFGTLTKLESVFTVDEKVAAGSLVFEELLPFTGYYHETPFNNTKPLYLYFALEENYPLEDIIRVTQQVEKEFDFKFDAGKGFLKLKNEKYNVLRVRHLRDYDVLVELQKAYAANGINYLHRQLKSGKEEAIIKIVKFLKLKELGEGIWIDGKEKNMGYIELPGKLSWTEFKDLTVNVKYNWVGSKFDAALGAFYHNGSLHEFVRIYSEKIGQEYLEEVRKIYLSKLK